MAATEKTGTHTWAEQEAAISNAKTSAAMLAAIGMTSDQVAALSGANAPSGDNAVATMADIPDVPEIPSQANMPTSDQKAALTGTSGTPTASNPYATKATTDAESSARSSGDALALKIASNLSDLNNAATARTNLGLGTAATTESTAYATAAQGALADTAVQPAAIVDQTFAAAVSTNPYSATPALTPRRIGDRAYNTTSLEWWDGIATAGATTSWQLAASGGSGSGDMTKAVYDTVNRGYVDRAVLADTATTATTAGTITGQGDAATKNVGTTAGTVAAGDDARIVAGGTALQPAGSGAALTGITASQVGAQASDADLTAIAALTGTLGFLKKTAADTWSLDTNVYITGNQSVTLSGDATGSGTTAIAVTLANTAVTAGSYGDASHVTTVTVDAKGRLTAASSTSIQIAGSQVTNLTTDLAAKAPLASPTFTGTPAAPTAAAATNTMQVATTAFVVGEVATEAAARATGDKTTTLNSQSTAYTLVLGDAGKTLLHPSVDTTARTFTIPANSSVAYPAGTVVTFVNQASAGVLSIAITSDTMRLAGAGTTGTRTLAANGMATAVKLTTTEWIISGVGLT